jgi:hypothetical protein
MGFQPLHKLYPLLADIIQSPTFSTRSQRSFSHTAVCNRWVNFWRLVGALERKCASLECVVCGAPFRKSGKTFCVCQRCLPRYRRLVQLGQVVPVFIERRCAA